MSNGTLTVQINNVNSRFQFEEVDNTTDGAVYFDPVLRTVIVVQAGDWDLTFNANGFSFMPNPVSWEGGVQPENVTLSDHDTTTFTLLNAVIDPQDPVKFLIHSDIQQLEADGSTSNKTVDPTILNNPQPGGGAPTQSSEELLLLIEA